MASNPGHGHAPERWRAALTELALAVLGMFCGMTALFLLRALGLWPSGEGGPRGLSLVGGPLITGIGALCYLAVTRRALLEPGDELPPLQPGDPLRGVATAGLGIAAAIVGSIVIGALTELVGAPVAEQDSIVEIVQDWRSGDDRTTVVVLGCSAVLLAPLAEESLFRGLLFARLRRGCGRTAAYLLSAIAFATIHGNPAGFVVYVWLGLVFAWTLERSGRLWPAMLVHMGNNAFAFAALLLTP